MGETLFRYKVSRGDFISAKERIYFEGETLFHGTGRAAANSWTIFDGRRAAAAAAAAAADNTCKKVFKQRKEEGGTLVRILLRIAGGLICWSDNPRAVETHLKKPRYFSLFKPMAIKPEKLSCLGFLFSSQNFYFFMSNSVNFYEFIGFITFNIAVHELISVYSFLLDRILVSCVPHATVPTLKPKTP